VNVRAELILTIDGGGTSVKASAYSLQTHQILTGVTEEYSASYPSPELAEFDPNSWWAAVVRAVRETVQRAGASPSAYTGITCTGMRIPFLLLDAHDEPLAPGVLNVDRRGQDYLDRVRAILGPEKLYALTGHWANAKFGLPKLLWFMDRQPELWRRARHVLQFHDWLVFGLSGELVSEPSSAAMSQLVDVRKRTWAGELLDALKLDSAMFPPMVDAGTRVGGLLPAVARETGLLTGTPVYAGGGDSHMSALGAGGAHLGDVSIIGGSTTPVMLVSDEPLLDSVNVPLSSPHLRSGLWAAETNAGVTGSLYTWLRDLVAPFRSPAGGNSYALIDELAAASPLGARDLLVACANPFWGEDAWEHVPPASIVGLTAGHSLGDVARATLECVSHAVRGNLEALEASLSKPCRRIIFTGGTSRSPFAAQMLADVLGREISVADVSEPSAVAGAALIAGEEAGSVQHTVYEADPERHAAYNEHGNHYLDSFARLREALG
jgi:xylulokinase